MRTVHRLRIVSSLAFTAVVALLSVGCPNAEQCYEEFTQCTGECEEALDAALERNAVCNDACEAAQAQGDLDCSQYADDQLAFVNCVNGVLSAQLACQAACVNDYAAAVSANQACREACGTAFLACTGSS